MSHIAFRTDATSLIGTGHFMRCLTLASALKNRDSHVRFVSRNLPEYLRDMLVERNIEFVSLVGDVTVTSDGDLAHSNWLGVSQAKDAEDAIDALSDQLWDWLVIDHYALDARWEGLLRLAAKKILVIDDVADRQHDCDVLLDQNFYADMQTRYVNKVSEHCKLLLGPQYALLRDEFRILREHIKPRSAGIKNILVFFGGIDADNYTGLTLEALAQIKYEGLNVDVVIGAQHPRCEEVQAVCLEYGYICYVQTMHMADLMAKADLAIGAGGSASWERCCLGLPSLLIAVAENQVEIAKELESISACIYLGLSRTVDSLDIKNAINNILSNHEQLEFLSKNALSLVDGHGVDKVCQVLVS